MEFDILNELADENEKHDHDDDGRDPGRDGKMLLDGDYWYNYQSAQVDVTIHTISGLREGEPDLQSKDD